MSGGTREIRILIAADHAVVRSGIHAFLENRQDWKICGEAATAADAIEKVKTLQPDLILLDLSLADMRAGQAIRQIIEACPAIHIVALVEQGSAELAANALVAGANGIVLKSEEPSDVISAVQSVSQGHPFLSPGAVALIQDELAKSKAATPERGDLTAREFQILQSLARGLGNKEVAEALGISVKTVNAHRANIMRKLKLRSYSELVQFAIRRGILQI